jgi:colanic acid biosynthesis glycosyl transferase WcaI
MRVAVHDYAGHPFQFDLSRALSRRGHEVRHFYFADDPGPKGDTKVRKDDPSGFSVEPIRIPLPYAKDKMWLRFLGDHLYAALASSRIAAFRPDVVISGNTPLDAQRALRATSHKIGAKFVFWVQDFYGLAMQKLLADRWNGAGRIISKRYRTIETTTLRKSDAIILISPGFARHLPPVLAGSNTVHVVRNWGSLDLITPRDRDNPWRSKMDLNGKFVFMYTGTLALKHDPRLLLALSDAFAQHEDVEIVVVATGVNARWLAEEQETKPRRNLKLLPLQPAADLPDVLATADVVVALLESDAGEFAVPSKLLNYLCAGRPILLSAPSDNLSVAIVEESGGGLTVAPQDKVGFVELAHQLYENGASRRQFGQSGRLYAERHFDMATIAAQFEAIFNNTQSSPVAPGILAPTPSGDLSPG